MPDNDTSNKEPVYTAGITSGGTIAGSFLMLQIPVKNLLIEVGVSQVAATSIVDILMVLISIGVPLATSWWARKYTVPITIANRQIEKAFDMPANSSQAKLEGLKIGGTGDGK